MLAFSYVLTGSGWAEVVLEGPNGTARMVASYLHDSLRQLAEATADLVCGATSASVTFMDEPGEHQLMLSRQGSQLLYEVRWYRDWASWDMYPKDRFDVRLSGSCAVAAFSASVLDNLQTLLATHGLEGYEQRWVEHPFPSQALTRLTELCAA